MYEQCVVYFSSCLYFLHQFCFVSLQNTFSNFCHLGFTQLRSSYILTTNKLELKRLLCLPWIDAVTINAMLAGAVLGRWGMYSFLSVLHRKNHVQAVV